jgi:hypothetical protein
MGTLAGGGGGSIPEGMMSLMQLVLLGGLGLALAGLALGLVLRRGAPDLARISHLSASALVRVLGAVAASWGAVRMLDQRNASHIAMSAFLVLVALGLLSSSALVIYVLITERRSGHRHSVDTEP